MTKQRIIETNEGIQDKMTVETFDTFAKTMRDKGWNNLDNIIKAGIAEGTALEIGSGPGYVGLEWLKRFPQSKLIGCEISKEMIIIAEKNAKDYGVEERVSYIEGNCMNMPFPDKRFDAVFSNGSLHEWENPLRVFNEISRVLKPGAPFCITDMRRDVGFLKKWMVYFLTKPIEMRPGFLTSLNASYTVDEINNILSQSQLETAVTGRDFFGLCIAG